MKKMNREVYKFDKKIIILLILIISIINFDHLFADGFVDDGYGNWLYEENGEYVKNDFRTIDGVSYYFNYEGYWLPTEKFRYVKLLSEEDVVFTMEGIDYENRKYKTEVKLPIPIVEGENAEAINIYIKEHFVETITKYFIEYNLNILFLKPKIEIVNMMEAQNNNGVICFGYFGGGMFNLYLNVKKMEMWAIPNTK